MCFDYSPCLLFFVLFFENVFLFWCWYCSLYLLLVRCPLFLLNMLLLVCIGFVVCPWSCFCSRKPYEKCSLFVVLVHELILCVWRCSLFSPLCSVSSVLSFVLWLCFLNLLFFVLDRVLCSCCSLFLFLACIIMFILCCLFFVLDLDAEAS